MHINYSDCLIYQWTKDDPYPVGVIKLDNFCRVIIVMRSRLRLCSQLINSICVIDVER